MEREQNPGLALFQKACFLLCKVSAALRKAMVEERCSEVGDEPTLRYHTSSVKRSDAYLGDSLWDTDAWYGTSASLLIKVISIWRMN